VTSRIKALAAIIAAALASCSSRATITETHGRSFRAAFDRQVANRAAKSKPPAGLDSQEAAIVAESYRGSLAPKGREVQEEPILVVTPQKQQRPPPLPPSVPPRQ
jgi:hypothetical protein